MPIRGVRRVSAVLTGYSSFGARPALRARVAPRDFPQTLRLVRTDTSRITLHARLEAEAMCGIANGLEMKVAKRDVVLWEA